MYRVDDPTRSVDELGAGKDGYSESTPGGTPTSIRADHLNALQEEPCNVIEAAGITLDKTNNAQLLKAIERMIARHAEIQGITAWLDIQHGESGDLRGIAAGPGDLVAVGTAGTILRCQLLDYDWDPITADAAYAANFLDVCYYAGATRFVAAGEDGEVQTSTDGGATWDEKDTGGDDYYCCCAATSFVAVAGDAGKLKTSADGITYTTRTSAHGSIPITAMCYSPTLNRILAVGPGLSIQRSDSTGVTWTAASDVTAITGSPDIDACCWSEEHQLFFVLDNTNKRVFKSVDGLVWTAATGVFAFQETVSATKIIALKEHLAVFSGGAPASVNLYRITDLDGTPPAANVIKLNLLDQGNELDVMRAIVLVPLGSGTAFEGRMLSAGDGAKIRATHRISF